MVHEAGFVLKALANKDKSGYPGIGNPDFTAGKRGMNTWFSRGHQIILNGNFPAGPIVKPETRAEQQSAA